MSFPETRLTLIQRLAAGGTAEDWQDFLGYYWGPVCRFALRSGAGQLNDAEDVAVQTFEVLWESRLLVRWIANRTAGCAACCAASPGKSSPTGIGCVRARSARS